MKVLIACEESQAVCKEMRRLGHEAYSADIQDCSGGYPEWHIKGNVLPLINGRCSFTTSDGVRHEIPDRWDMLIAHPPCTFLTKAGANLMRVNGDIVPDRYAKALPRYSQLIQPFEFGDPYSKKTCLWLKGLPPLMGTVICSDYVSYTALHRSARMRSKTFPGIAAAMADQWSRL